MAQHGKKSSGSSGRERPDLLELGPEGGQGSDLLEFEETPRLQASIKVIGIGGGGSNALNTMMRAGLEGVDFVVANTDAQALQYSRAPVKIQLGNEVTRGLGCGANPEKGRAAALEARERLRELLTGTDMVFVTAGLGGGTGTGAAPIVAEIAREVGALTVAVVTRPFQFEGKVRSRHAERGLEELHRVVDTLITIPNHRLLALAGKSATVKDAFRLADDVLYNAVKGISDLITVHGLINLDFADVRTIMSEMGMALMGTGIGHGETRAADAARSAISSPLLEDLSIEGARGVLINITGGADMTLYEVNEAATLVQEAAHEDANIIFGAVVDERLGEGELRVTVIATGLDDGRIRRDPGRDRDLDTGELSNVMPLRREASRTADGAPAAMQPALFEESALPVAAPKPVRPVAPAGFEPAANSPAAREFAVEELARPEDFMSPFEDEMDVPAFLRRKTERTRRLLEEEDIEAPAFLRRSAD
jgi:cell division protein FtsZ